MQTQESENLITIMIRLCDDIAHGRIMKPVHGGGRERIQLRIKHFASSIALDRAAIIDVVRDGMLS